MPTPQEFDGFLIYNLNAELLMSQLVALGEINCRNLIYFERVAIGDQQKNLSHVIVSCYSRC